MGSFGKTGFALGPGVLPGFPGFDPEKRVWTATRRRAAQRAPHDVRWTDDGEFGGRASVSAAAGGAGPAGGELLFRCGAFGARHGVTFRLEL